VSDGLAARRRHERPPRGRLEAEQKACTRLISTGLRPRHLAWRLDCLRLIFDMVASFRPRISLSPVADCADNCRQ
jgi:hypothetical protein